MQTRYRKHVRDAAVTETVHSGSFHVFGVARKHSVGYRRRVAAQIFKEKFPHGRIYRAEQRKAVFGREQVYRIGRTADIFEYARGALAAVSERLAQIHCAVKGDGIADVAELAVNFVEIDNHVPFDRAAVRDYISYLYVFAALAVSLFPHDARKFVRRAVGKLRRRKGRKFKINAARAVQKQEGAYNRYDYALFASAEY